MVYCVQKFRIDLRFFMVQRVHRIYSIVIAVSVLIAGISLVAGCLTIYFSSDVHPYSREAVADVFRYIAIPVCLCPVLALFGFVLELAAPSEKVVTRVKKDNTLLLAHLVSQRSLTNGDNATAESICRERTLRKRLSKLTLLVLVIGGALFLGYAVNGNHFDQADINGSMVRAMFVLFPCVGIPFVFALFAARFNEKSICREIELVKQLPVNAEKKRLHTAAPLSDTVVTAMRTVLLIAGIAFLVYGIASGGVADVLAKATKICTECIGLG